MAGFNYVLSLRSMASMAGVVGNASEAARYASLAEEATSSFHTAFWNPAVKEYGGDAGAVQSLSSPALHINSPPTDL
jgi:hypothetical protein